MGLTNSQYNTLMRDYERQQLADQQQLTDRRREIYGKFPAFAELDREISSASTACARAILLGGEESGAQAAANGAGTYRDPAGKPSVDTLRSHIRKLSAQKADLLAKAGYPKDYLELHYRCRDCQDTGYIGTQKCHCFQQAIIDLLYTQSNLKEFLDEENFSRFSLDYYSGQQTDAVTGQTARQTARRALEECRRFVRDFDRSFENLFLYGDTGLGKTFLSHCIARELLETTHSVIYFSAFRLFDLFAQATFGRGSSDAPTELEQHIFECDFLIIDDLGTEMTNTFVSSQLFLILNERILRRKSTLISTNLSLRTFSDTYSERVFSRISSSYTMLKLIGDDIRIQKKLGISASKASSAISSRPPSQSRPST